MPALATMDQWIVGHFLALFSFLAIVLCLLSPYPPHPPKIWIDSLSCQYNNYNATHCHSSLMSSSLQLTATCDDFYLIYICHSFLFSVLCSRWDLFMNAFVVVVVLVFFFVILLHSIIWCKSNECCCYCCSAQFGSVESKMWFWVYWHRIVDSWFLDLL